MYGSIYLALMLIVRICSPLHLTVFGPESRSVRLTWQPLVTVTLLNGAKTQLQNCYAKPRVYHVYVMIYRNQNSNITYYITYFRFRLKTNEVT